MLRLPHNDDDQARFYMAFTMLESTPAYQEVKRLALDPTLMELRVSNDTAQGDQLKWNQGACQLLSEILDTAETAQTTLQKLREAYP